MYVILRRWFRTCSLSDFRLHCPDLAAQAAGKTKQNFTRLGFTVRQFYPFVLRTTVFDTVSLPGGTMSIERSVKAAELSTLNRAFLVPHVAHVVSSFKCLLFVSACSRLQNWQSRNLQGEHGQLGWQLRGAEGSLLEGDSSEESKVQPYRGHIEFLRCIPPGIIESEPFVTCLFTSNTPLSDPLLPPEASLAEISAPVRIPARRYFCSA